MSDDVWQDPSSVLWVNNVLENMVPKLRDSACTISLLPSGDDAKFGDVKYWVELGASICMDKPILLVVLGDRSYIPEKLRLVADSIVRIPEGVTPETSDVLADAIKRFLANFVEGGSGGK